MGDREREISSHRDTVTEGERLCKDGHRDWSDMATSQGSPRVDENHWEPERGKEKFSPMAFNGSVVLTTLRF